MKTTKILIGAATILVAVIVAAFVLRDSERKTWDSSPLEPAKVEAKAKNADYDLSSIVILTKVVSYIKNNYYDPKRVQPQKMFISALQEVSRNVASVLVDFNETEKSVVVRVGDKSQKFSYKDIDSPWDIQYRISEIFRFMQPNFEEYVDPKEVEYAAINGMLDTLDPHSTHISPRGYSELKISTVGNFGGLGIQIGIREGELTIISPIDGTPASRAGLKSLDTIVRIDDQSTVNMGLDEAVNLMRGRSEEHTSELQSQR